MVSNFTVSSDLLFAWADIDNKVRISDYSYLYAFLIMEKLLRILSASHHKFK